MNQTERYGGLILAELLREYGVRYVFGVPGGQTLGLYRGLLDQAQESDSPRHVLLRDERSASFAADACARVSRTTGVCDATVGPGATNLISGLGEAYASSTPMLAVASDVRSSWNHLRHRATATQALDDAMQMFVPVTKKRFRVEAVEQFADVVDAAFKTANVGRPGPVVLEIPEDAFLERNDNPIPPRARPKFSPWYRCAPDPALVQEAAKRLRAASRPVLVAGGGALAASAEEELGELARRLRCPVLTTMSGKGVVSEDDDVAGGVVGSMGHPFANDLVKAADLVVFIGAKGGQFSTLDWSLPPSHTSIIHIDIDPEVFSQRRGSLALWADARLALAALLREISHQPANATDDLLLEAKKRQRAWLDSIQESRRRRAPLRPQDIVRLMSDSLDSETLLTCDASLSSGWGATLYRTRCVGRSFLAPRGLAGLGWGAPAAIGAALAVPARPIACLAGDGAWGYSLAEVETMVRLNLPILNVVLNNSVLAWSKHGQVRRLQGRHLSTDFVDVDYAASAVALGATGIRVNELEALEAEILRWKKSQIPTVLDVRTDPDETPVIGMGGGPRATNGG